MNLTVFLFNITGFYFFLNTSLSQAMNPSPLTDLQMLRETIIRDRRIVDAFKDRYQPKSPIPSQTSSYSTEEFHEYSNISSCRSKRWEENRKSTLQCHHIYRSSCNPLFTAIKAADIITLEAILQNNAQASRIIDIYGMTPLSFFASCLQNPDLYSQVSEQRNALSIGITLERSFPLGAFIKDTSDQTAITKLLQIKNSYHGSRSIIAGEILSRIRR